MMRQEKQLLPNILQEAYKRSRDDLVTWVGDISSPTHTRYFPLDHQLEFINAMRTGKYDEGYFSGGNSAGKTWTGKFMGSQWATWKIKPGKPWKTYSDYVNTPYNVLCTGPEQKQAIELWEKIVETFKTSPILKFKVAEIHTSTRLKSHPHIRLKNGSFIEAVGLQDKGKHVEGEAYDLIMVNEPADVRFFQHVLDRVLVPRTWRRGGIVVGFGTPKGKGEYWQIIRRGIDPDHELMGGRNPFHDPAVYTMFADSRLNPFAEQEKIAKMLNTGNADLIAERIRGYFVDESSLAFPDSHIERAINDELPLIIKPSTNHFYLTGVDFGRKVDFTVGATLDITNQAPPYTLVNLYRKGGGVATWEEILGDMLNISHDYYGEFVVDSTSAAGDMQLEWLNDMGISNIPYQFAGSPAKKSNLITNLQRMLGNGELVMPYHAQLRDELHNYPKNMDDKNLETDCVMALALACWGAKEFGPLGDVESIHR